MSTQSDRLLAKLMKGSLVNVPDSIARVPAPVMLDASRSAEYDLQQLTLISVYVHERATGQSHKTALKAAQRKVVKVRRALGYSYPKSGLATVSF